MAITDWEISKTTLSCATDGRQFDEEEEIYSALYDEEGVFVRRDYCVGCWPPADTGKVFSFWKTRIPSRNAPAKKFVDDEVIMDFFKRLEGHNDEQKRNFRYVLSLLLMRKKVLKFVSMQREGDDLVMALHDRVADATYEVIDPRLSEEQINQVSDEIGQVLNVKI